jgi:hypothetical protein
MFRFLLRRELARQLARFGGQTAGHKGFNFLHEKILKAG